jgi:actin-related protein 5
MESLEWMGDQELIPLPDIEYDTYRNTNIPVLIDWGAYRSRVGFATSSRPPLIFRSLISKQRAKKDSHVLVGNDIVDIEAVKRVLRSPFEFDVCTQFDSMETIFDYIFHCLSIDTNRVEHPVVLNEAFCVPLWSRTNAQELLFECYGIPSLLLGVDALFSLYHNLADIRNCLVICLGHYTCHVVVVMDGTVCCERSTRINLGGLNLSLYLQRLMQLKYPKLMNEFSFTKCEQIVQKFCRFSSDYQSDSSQWSHDLYFNQYVKRFKATKSVGSDTSQPTATEKFEQRTQRLLKKVKTSLVKKREKQVYLNLDYELTFGIICGIM